MRGEPKLVKQLLRKAKDATLLAVEFYNKPTVAFKSEGFITMMLLAWNALFHAYFIKHNQKPFYRKKVEVKNQDLKLLKKDCPMVGLLKKNGGYTIFS